MSAVKLVSNCVHTDHLSNWFETFAKLEASF